MFERNLYFRKNLHATLGMRVYIFGCTLHKVMMRSSWVLHGARGMDGRVGSGWRALALPMFFSKKLKLTFNNSHGTHMDSLTRRGCFFLSTSSRRIKTKTVLQASNWDSTVTWEWPDLRCHLTWCCVALRETGFNSPFQFLISSEKEPKRLGLAKGLWTKGEKMCTRTSQERKEIEEEKSVFESDDWWWVGEADWMHACTLVQKISSSCTKTLEIPFSIGVKFKQLGKNIECTYIIIILLLLFSVSYVYTSRLYYVHNNIKIKKRLLQRRHMHISGNIIIRSLFTLAAESSMQHESHKWAENACLLDLLLLWVFHLLVIVDRARDKQNGQGW